MSDTTLIRYRVRVANPPRPRHRGFIVWACDESAARAKAEAHGYRVLSVRQEEVPDTWRAAR